MNPTMSDLHVEAALTDISIAFTNDDTNSVYDKVFQIIPVMKQSDKFYIYDRKDWLRTDAKRRAPGAEIALSGWRVSLDTYFCERFGLGHDIPDPVRANADPAVSDLDADTTEFLSEDLRIKHEVDWVAKFFITGVWTGASSTQDMTGQAAPASTATNFLQWNDVASTPIEDLRGEMTAVSKRTGKRPNILTINEEVWTALADHPDILDRIKYTERGVVTTDLLASLLGLEAIYVASMVRNSAIEGQPESMGFIASGKNALLTYRPRSPGLRTAAAGYTFSWTGMAGAPPGGIGARIKSFRVERNESDRLEAEDWKDFTVIGAERGAMFLDAVA